MNPLLTLHPINVCGYVSKEVLSTSVDTDNTPIVSFYPSSLTKTPLFASYKGHPVPAHKLRHHDVIPTGKSILHICSITVWLYPVSLLSSEVLKL